MLKQRITGLLERYESGCDNLLASDVRCELENILADETHEELTDLLYDATDRLVLDEHRECRYGGRGFVDYDAFISRIEEIVGFELPG